MAFWLQPTRLRNRRRAFEQQILDQLQQSTNRAHQSLEAFAAATIQPLNSSFDAGLKSLTPVNTVQKQDQQVATTEAQSDNDYDCAICSDYYSTPKMLPNCGHSFCCACLQQYVGNFSKVVCPLCRIETPLGEGGVQALKTNIALQNLVERERSRNNEENLQMSDSGRCPHVQHSGRRQACEHCSESFCPDCRIVHMEKLKSEIIKLEKSFQQRFKNASVGIDEKERAINVVIEEDVKAIEKEVGTVAENFRNTITQLIEQSKSNVVEEAKSAAANELDELKSVMALVKEPPYVISGCIEELKETSLFECSLDSVSILHQKVKEREQQLAKLETLNAESYRGKIRLNGEIALKIKPEPFLFEIELGSVVNDNNPASTNNETTSSNQDCNVIRLSSGLFSPAE